MAADEDNDWEIFIYRGGRAPEHVTHARIDESVYEIIEDAFNNCKENLLTVETHDGIRIFGYGAFIGCKYLRRMNLKSAVEIDGWAFSMCENLRQ